MQLKRCAVLVILFLIFGHCANFDPFILTVRQDPSFLPLLPSVLILLDRPTVRLIAENPRVIEFVPDLRDLVSEMGELEKFASPVCWKYFPTSY